MKEKILSYMISGIVYFLVSILFQVISNREIDILWITIESVIWLVLFALITEIISKITKKK